MAAEIRRAIAEGEAVQGERLPPAVDLATVLGVNKNTVIRALHILRDEGLLDFTRGRGVRVVGTPQRGAVMTRIDELLTSHGPRDIAATKSSHSSKLGIESPNAVTLTPTRPSDTRRFADSTELLSRKPADNRDAGVS